MIDVLLANEIENLVSSLPTENFGFTSASMSSGRENRITELIESKIQNLSDSEKNRFRSEFLGLGPIENLLQDNTLTEVLILSPNSIFIEKNGQLHTYDDCFSTEQTYFNFIDRLSSKIGQYLTKELPAVTGNFNGFRVQIISRELTGSYDQVSIRMHPLSPWNLSSLKAEGFCTDPQTKIIQKILTERMNFLVVGSTGTGKTSLINACLQETHPCERSVVIEDSPEIQLSNRCSTKLLTRCDPQKILPEITQSDLVRHALRLRPDRIVMGEIRGGEAKDFLMAISTGHSGSFGSLHAQSAAQALIRLEMLVQIGAPTWGLQAIRRMIQLSLQIIVVIDRSKDGRRFMEGIYRLMSLEEFGFSIERLI